MSLVQVRGQIIIAIYVIVRRVNRNLLVLYRM